LKPVHWSIENRTALADAELEYHDRKDPSIFVAFQVVAGQCEGVKHCLETGTKLSLLVWTTTPWTLPANRAVAVHPRMDYVSLEADTPAGKQRFVVAAERKQAVLAAIEKAQPGYLQNVEQVAEFKGQALLDAEIWYQHPLDADLRCSVVGAEYVTLEDGTGLVHTAPGHGTDDYFTGLANGLDIYCPVQADGTFDETVPAWLCGLGVWNANPKVVEHLTAAGTLLASETVTHSYPHDWRSKTPTIFRATEQWFVGVDTPLATTGRSLRDMARDVCAKNTDDGGVNFIPGWGRNRILGMLESRPDWCLSRQRSWGLPIPAFYNEKNQPLCTAASVRAVAKVIGQKGSDAWFELSPAELLAGYDPAKDSNLEHPADFKVASLTKGFDIFDVWFESGSSWFAVAQQRGLVEQPPVDLYLEGSDQHRGWFQLSLLPALGAANAAPFQSVLTHGFVVTEDGHKMSKSLGNAIEPREQLTKRGADILRLWVASQNYQDDVRCSENLIAQAEESYRKIRNTLRFCLGSIDDYDPETDTANPAAHSVDLWMRMELHQLIQAVREAFDRYEFHRATRIMYEFCTVQASSVYMSAVKDRLYCEAPNSPRRRATQGVLREVVVTLVKLLAPILPHTAEEAWEHIPHKPADWPESVHLSQLPDVDAEVMRFVEDIEPVAFDDGTAAGEELRAGPAWVWERLMDIRGEALLKIEALRNAGVKNPLDTEVVFSVPENKPGLRAFLEQYLAELEDLLGVGYARVEAGEAPEDKLIGIEVRDTRETYARCERSWKRRPDVGADADYPSLSARDAAVMKQLA
ncbi:MAG: isoleucine--tRNA ligase, partial [Phycisphaerae bacterium]|nr:isoleucine--tRNA ligase [Phycisphaerae bacterium]